MRGTLENGVILSITGGSMVIRTPAGTSFTTNARKGITVGDYVKFSYNFHKKKVRVVIRADEHQLDTLAPHLEDHPEINYHEEACEGDF